MGYMRDSTGRRLDSIEVLSKGYAGALPSGLGWDTAVCPVTPTLTDTPGAGVVGSAGITPAALFDLFSTARSAPAATYWVDGTSGVDTNAGTQAAPFKSLFKAEQAANAAAVPTLVNVLAGTFARSLSFYFQVVTPTVDIAFVAVGGRVVTGPFDLFTISTRDATNTRCFTVAVANCDKVLDTANADQFGNHRELVQVADAAACNLVPNSWSLVAGTLYIHRGDEAAITPGNTRVFRNQPFNFLVQNPVNVYMDGFDLEGAPGSAVARVDMGAAGLSATPKAAVFANCSFKYGGGAIGTATIGLAASSWNGVVAAFNCQADGNATDGFNSHNAQGVAKPLFLTVNCSARDNGRGAAASCNGLTIHEDVKGIDIGGDYRRNRGGTIRNINASKAYLFGTTAADDLGDIRLGGVVPPTAVRADDTAVIWAERVKVPMPRGTFAYATGSSTAAIHRRNCAPVPQPDQGVGTFDSY